MFASGWVADVMVIAPGGVGARTMVKSMLPLSEPTIAPLLASLTLLTTTLPEPTCVPFRVIFATTSELVALVIPTNCAPLAGDLPGNHVALPAANDTTVTGPPTVI